jgi:hypothetical protein
MSKKINYTAIKDFESNGVAYAKGDTWKRPSDLRFDAALTESWRASHRNKDGSYVEATAFTYEKQEGSEQKTVDGVQRYVPVMVSKTVILPVN